MINDDIVLRLKELIIYLKMTPNSFSKELGYASPEKLNRILRVEGAKPSYEIIFDIANKFAIVNIEWLITGNGKMLKTTNDYNSKNNNIQKIDENAIAPKLLLNTEGRSIPLLSGIEVAAGSGIYNNDNVNFEESIHLPQRMLKSKDAYYAAPKIKGDSMAPTLQDSGYVVSRLLTKQEWTNMPNEQIFIVTDKDCKSAIKRVKNRLKQGFITLMSDNPDKASYPNYNLEVDEIINIWHVEWYISAKMPNVHDQYYNRLQRLEDEFEDMKRSINKGLKS